MSTTAPNPDYFVQLPITTDVSTLQDRALDFLATLGIIPNEGDPEVINIEAWGPIIGDAQAIAALMPMTALVNAGQKLWNVPFQSGAPASTTVTFNLQDDAGGYKISAGSQLAIDGFAFNVLTDLVSTAGSTTVDGEAISAENSTSYNGLTGTTVAPITIPPYVVSMSVDAATDGAIDPQDIPTYVSDLSQELRLTIRTICTLPDFEFAATAIDGILRAHAVSTPTRDVTVWLLGANAPSAVPEQLQDELVAAYAANRVVNVTTALETPTFNALSVTWAGKFLPGFDTDDAEARGNSALSAELSPTGWGAPAAGDQGNVSQEWFSQNVVKVARLLTVLSRMDGCYEIDTVTIAGQVGTTTAALGTTARTTIPVTALPGAVPVGAAVTVGTGATAITKTTTAAAAAGATSFTVASFTPATNWPSGSAVSVSAAADFTMEGTVALPTPGTMAGTVTTLS